MTSEEYIPEVGAGPRRFGALSPTDRFEMNLTDLPHRWRHRRAVLSLAIAAAISALGGSGGVAAQVAVPDSAALDIPGIEVTGERAVALTGGASALEIDVRSLPLLRAAPTVEDLFREIPGLGVRTNSRGQAEITVRGSESRQVAVLLDGIPLSLGWDHRSDVSVLPATAVEHVQFVRGLSTMTAGPNALGGVVRLSLTEGAEPGLRASSGSDQLGGWTASGDVTHLFAEGRGVVRIGGGYRDIPAVPLADDVDERPQAESGERQNTDMRNVDGFLALRYETVSGRWASFTAVGHDTDRGIAAELGTANARFWRQPDTRRGLFALRAGTGEQDSPWGRGSIEAGIFLDESTEETVAFEGADFDVIEGIERGDGTTVTGRVRGSHSLGARGTLRASTDYVMIDFDTEEDGVSRAFDQRLLSTALETEWRVAGDAGTGPFSEVTLSFGGAYDRMTVEEAGGLPLPGAIEEWGGRVGVAAEMRSGPTLHANVSRRGRFPALREAFSEALGRFVPNPGLGAETLVAIEAGVTVDLGTGQLQVVGFRNDLSDAIRRITFADGTRQRVNSDELESHGVDIFTTQRVGPFLVGGDLRLQSVELTDPGLNVSTEPENVPEQEGRIWTEWGTPSVLRIRGEAEFTGSQFCQDLDTGEDVELDGGTWLNGVISRVWSVGTGMWGQVETSLRATNLADTTLHDQCGLPRPGRTLSFQVSVK
ncbi:MAG: TonB-dependent receptor [Longimicrobiales bacterium]|nr:TonB-dependent receptor [Longimicrobiales bacterium]